MGSCGVPAELTRSAPLDVQRLVTHGLLLEIAHWLDIGQEALQAAQVRAVHLIGRDHRAVGTLHGHGRAGVGQHRHREAEMRGLPLSLVKGEDVTEAQVPSIFRHRHVTLSCDKIGRSLGMPVKRARAILEALFAGFPQPAASPAR